MELVDHGGSLPQLDKAGHPVQDDLGTVGLGHKVRGPMGQGRHLVLLAVALRGHDDRDEGKLSVIPDPVQEGIAVHHRHHHIQ